MILPVVACMALGQGAVPMLNRPARPFHLKDRFGNWVSPQTLAGSPTVLFVFCSCRECRLVAQKWADVERKGVLQTAPYLDGGTPKTVISYLGAIQDSAALAQAVGLSKSAILLEDPKMTIARDYLAMPCPALYVFDRKGTVRYASKEQAGKLVSDPDLLVRQALAALRLKTKGAVLQLPAPPVSVKGLTGIPRADESAPNPGQLEWSPEKFKVSREGDVAHTFRFRNASSKVIQVAQVVASCGCQSLELVQDGRVASKLNVRPGKEFELRMTIRLPGNGSGKTVSAWLYSPAQVPLGSVRAVLLPQPP